jgi:hypothetical protein
VKKSKAWRMEVLSLRSKPNKIFKYLLTLNSKTLLIPVKKYCILISFLLGLNNLVQAQTAQDTIAIKRAALAYIEAQHTPNPKLMESALHPRLVKRSVFKSKSTKKDYVSEYFTENMIILAESYNAKGDKFPKNPKKEVKLLDVSAKTASVKLIADEWIDYMHIVKINDEWKIINVLWQYNNLSEHE